MAHPGSSRIAAVAARQHGVIATWQLREAGVSSSTVSRWVAAGRLVPLRRGVYAVGHRSLTRDGWWHAAALATGPMSALTARAACEIWNVLPPGNGPIDVIAARRVCDPPPWLRICRTSAPPLDVIVRRGLPVTFLPRTIVELADRGTAHEVATALDRSLLLKLLDRRALDEEIARAQGRHGLKILLPAVARLSEEGETFLSNAERDARDALLDSGLPRPEPNVHLDGPEGQRCRPDLLWRDAGLIVEVDGPQHELPYQRELDRTRDAWLTRAGYRVLRFPVRQVDDHLTATVQHIAAALRDRHDRGVCRVVPTPRD